MLNLGSACMELATMAAADKQGQEKGKMVIYTERIVKFLRPVWRTFWKVGHDDPRRVIHALKVGLALTLVSLLYVLEPLFHGVGQNAMWAVMTVVVVLEFTAGATLCKGLNRGLGTALAGSLAFFIEFVANKSNHVFRAVFIGSSVFVIGAVATYIRFFPYIKKNHDYAVVVFLLTFNLITVSSYRVISVLKIAQERFFTIAIGCGICLLMSLFVFPIWSGKELHHRTISKLEGLATSIEACVNQYFSDSILEDPEDSSSSDDVIYAAVLDSKSVDDTLALYARWEPRYSKYRFRFPWRQYVKVGAALRHFGYTVVALHGCLQTEIQTPKAIRALFKGPCIQLSLEVSIALRELASSIRNRRHCSPSILSDRLQQALQDLDNALKSQPRLFLQPTTPTNNHFSPNATLPSNLRNESLEKKRILRPTLSKIAMTSLEFAEALPFAAFASLLVETVARLDRVIDEVEELGRVAHFKEFSPGDEVVVKCDDGKPMRNGVDNHLPSHGGE